jgi:hypothetical protein
MCDGDAVYGARSRRCGIIAPMIFVADVEARHAVPLRRVMDWNVGAQRCCALVVGKTGDGAPEHHPNVGFWCVGAGSEPARTIVSIVLMCDGVWCRGTSRRAPTHGDALQYLGMAMCGILVCRGGFGTCPYNCFDRADV